MDQVAIEREKELGIINRIEAVEKQHHDLKKLNMLRRADVEAERRRKNLLKKQGNKDDFDKDLEGDPHRLSWWEMLLLYLIFTSKSSFLSHFNFSQSTPISGEPTPKVKGAKLRPEVE